MRSAQNINITDSVNEMVDNERFAQDQKVSARVFKNKIRKGKQTRDLSQKIEHLRHQERTEPNRREDEQ